jgi:hypothetical protein
VEADNLNCCFAGLQDRAPLALAPCSETRAPWLMAPWPLIKKLCYMYYLKHNFLLRDVRIHYVLKVTVVESS